MGGSKYCEYGRKIGIGADVGSVLSLSALLCPTTWLLQKRRYYLHADRVSIGQILIVVTLGMSGGPPICRGDCKSHPKAGPRDVLNEIGHDQQRPAPAAHLILAWAASVVMPWAGHCGRGLTSYDMQIRRQA